jgi:hypothetical protein
MGCPVGLIVAIVFEDGVAHLDAFITDVGPRIIAGRGN